MTPPKPKPQRKRAQTPRVWSRAIAIVAAPIAVLMVAIRFQAMVAGGSTSYELGRILGQIVLGPLVIGTVIWGGIVLYRRRGDRSEPFLGAGLLAAVAIVAIFAALASVRR